MRLIDADKLRKNVLDLPNCYNGFSDTFDKAMILDLVDEQPTVPFIDISALPIVDNYEIVRCKDCKYYEETDSRIGTCLLTISGAEVGGFCAWGEIKDETD